MKEGEKREMEGQNEEMQGQNEKVITKKNHTGMFAALDGNMKSSGLNSSPNRLQKSIRSFASESCDYDGRVNFIQDHGGHC